MATPRSLQQEIAQSSPFRSLAEESTLGIVRTATLIRRAVARAVAQTAIEQGIARADFVTYAEE